MNVEIIKNKNGESIYPLSHADSTLYDSTTSQTVKSKIDSMCSDLSIASSTTSTTITDSADGYIRNFVAYGKSGQGENPTPTSPQDILAWDGKITTKNADESKTSSADLGINLYGIKVASGGNYTDADGQQWKSDYIDLKKGVHGKWVDTTKIDTTEAINESWLLSSVVEEELTEEQISALRNLQTYADGTTIEYGTLNPFATIDYWKNTDNGQAVADVDAKINKLFALLSPATTSEPAQLLYAPTE